MIEKVDKFTRKLEIIPAFDKRDKDPSKNYGIHGMELRFILMGEKGATQFVVYTGIQLPHVRNEIALDSNVRRFELLTRPMGADIGYHSYEPTYEGQSLITEDNCPYLDNAPCYYDGSGLQAEDFLPVFLEKGEDAVWEMLEERYVSLFGK